MTPNDSTNIHGHECQGTLDDLLFSQEDLDFQSFDLESDLIIEDFLSGISCPTH